MKLRIALSLSIFCDTSSLWAAPPQGQSLCVRNPSECSLSSRTRSKSAPESKEISDQVHTTAAKPSSTAPTVQHAKGVRQVIKERTEVGGNLPTYLTDEPRAVSGELSSMVIAPEKVLGALLPGLRSGDVLQAVVDQSIKASPSVPTPLRARVTSGRFRGVILLGSATLDRELKRILLSFERLRISAFEASYQLKATGLAPSGQVGIEGNYHTQEGALFAGELAASAVAGYADATTSRTQTLLGSYQIEPSVGNAAKQGAVSALSKTAERFAERARTAPEYTEVEAGRAIQIIIQESPTEVSGG